MTKEEKAVVRAAMRYMAIFDEARENEMKEGALTRYMWLCRQEVLSWTALRKACARLAKRKP